MNNPYGILILDLNLLRISDYIIFSCTRSYDSGHKYYIATEPWYIDFIFLWVKWELFLKLCGISIFSKMPFITSGVALEST